jgi:hypothetical protein
MVERNSAIRNFRCPHCQERVRIGVQTHEVGHTCPSCRKRIVTFSCGKCLALLVAKADVGGQERSCRRCGERLHVPNVDNGQASQEPWQITVGAPTCSPGESLIAGYVLSTTTLQALDRISNQGKPVKDDGFTLLPGPSQEIPHDQRCDSPIDSKLGPPIKPPIDGSGSLTRPLLRQSGNHMPEKRAAQKSALLANTPFFKAADFVTPPPVFPMIEALRKDVLFKLQDCPRLLKLVEENDELMELLREHPMADLKKLEAVLDNSQHYTPPRHDATLYGSPKYDVSSFKGSFPETPRGRSECRG